MPLHCHVCPSCMLLLTFLQGLKAGSVPETWCQNGCPARPCVLPFACSSQPVCRANALSSSGESILKSAIAQILAPLGVVPALIYFFPPTKVQYRRRLQVWQGQCCASQSWPCNVWTDLSFTCKVGVHLLKITFVGQGLGNLTLVAPHHALTRAATLVSMYKAVMGQSNLRDRCTLHRTQD